MHRPDGSLLGELDTATLGVYTNSDRLAIALRAAERNGIPLILRDNISAQSAGGHVKRQATVPITVERSPGASYLRAKQVLQPERFVDLYQRHTKFPHARGEGRATAPTSQLSIWPPLHPNSSGPHSPALADGIG